MLHFDNVLLTIDSMQWLMTIVPVLLVAALSTPVCSESVTIGVKSGREFTGQIDAQTDALQLWLRIARDGVSIRRPIAWSQIVGARLAGREWTVDVLRTAVSNFSSTVEANEGWSDGSSNGPRNGGTFTVLSAVTNHPSATLIEPATSIEIDAYAAKWDADVEVDGLVVRITPTDASGKATTVQGTLYVEWIAKRPVAMTTRNYRVGRDLGPRFVRAGRWTRRLTNDLTGPEGVTFRLPFQANHPEFDLDLGDFGLVNARLAVPGQGVLNASNAMVRVRPYSAIRNARERLDNARFFPIERTGRTN